MKGKDGTFYKGITNNLDRKLSQHKSGQNLTTKNMGGFSLIHVEICRSRVEARNLEKFFKSGFGREVLKELFS